MPVIAELFDGTELEFPDGTDPGIIQGKVKELTLSRQQPAQQPGWGQAVMNTASEYLGRTGRRMTEAKDDFNKLPTSAKNLVTGEGGRAQAGMDLLSGLAAPFNVMSAPIEAAGETAAKGGLGLSEEASRIAGSGFGVAMAGGLGLLTKAGKLNKAGVFINELVGVGSPGPDFKAKPGALKVTDKLRADWEKLNQVDRDLVKNALQQTDNEAYLSQLLRFNDFHQAPPPPPRTPGKPPPKAGPFEDIYQAEKEFADTQHAEAQLARATQGSDFLAEQFLSAKTREGVPRPEDVTLAESSGRDARGRFQKKGPLGVMEGERLQLEGPRGEIPPEPPKAAPESPLASTKAPTEALASTDTVRLYRGESTKPAKDLPKWVREGIKENGSLDAQGRWFTDDPKIAEWYAKEAGDESRIVAVDVPREVAERARVTKSPQALRFSRDPDTEYFLGRDVAEKKQPVPRVIDTDTLQVTKFQPERIPQKLEQIPEVNAAPKDLRPAIRMNDGTVKIGEAGKRHDSVFEKIPEKQIDSIKDTGWVDESGKFMTANEATAAKFAADMPDYAGVAKKKSALDLIKGGFGSETGAVGKLNPTQAALEAQARADRAELYSRIVEASKKTGRGLGETADEMGVARSVLRRAILANRVDNVTSTLGSAADGLERLNERATAIAPEVERIAEKGTVERLTRDFLREKTGKKPRTYESWISEKAIDQNRNALIQAHGKIQEIMRSVEDTGDAITVMKASAARDQLAAAIKQFNREANLFRKQGFIWGRAGRAYQRAPFSADTIEALKQAGANVEGLIAAKERAPIDTNILQSVGRMLSEKSLGALSPSEQIQLRKDLIDTVRLKLFPVTSFLLDLRANVVETGTQAFSGLIGDLVHVGRGNLSMPSTRGMMNAMYYRTRAEAIEKALGLTAGSEHVPGQISLRQAFSTIGKDTTASGKSFDLPGAFTARQNLPSAIWDTFSGAPMYAKAAVDTGFKRFAASASIWRQAFEAADAQGLRGLDRQAFVDNYWKNLPQAALDEAIGAANRAGFNRPLSRWEEAYARSSTVKLLAEAFARYPFQFARWSGEMLGANPTFLKKAIAGQAGPEEIARYLTRTATGWGGVYLIDRMYNHNPDGYIDYNSMEWVDNDGNRQRLSGQDYITMPLFLAAAGKAAMQAARGEDNEVELAKLTGAMRFVSLPGLRLLYGEGGMFGRLNKLTADSLEQGKIPTDTLAQEFDSVVNRMIPGQAVLSALKGVFDPIQREGFGKNVPGVSLLKDPRIDLSTGEPLQTRQRYMGVEFPAIAGTPIPGATRLMPEVAKLLSRYGGMEYRGPRLPIAGYRASEAPDEITRQWQIEFGRTRDKMLGQLIPSIEAAELRRSPQERAPGTPFYEEVRKLVQKYDSMAARHAKNMVDIRARHSGKMNRELTVKEKRRERAFE